MTISKTTPAPAQAGDAATPAGELHIPSFEPTDVMPALEEWLHDHPNCRVVLSSLTRGTVAPGRPRLLVRAECLGPINDDGPVTATSAECIDPNEAIALTLEDWSAEEIRRWRATEQDEEDYPGDSDFAEAVRRTG